MNKTVMILMVLAVGYGGKAWAGPMIDLGIIAKIESSGKEGAINKGEQAYGLYQIRQGVIDNYNKLSGSRRRYKLEDMLDHDKAYTVANWYLHDRIPAMLRHFKLPVTKERVLWAYNAGIKAVLEGRMPKKTVKYLNDYHNMENKHNGY